MRNITQELWNKEKNYSTPTLEIYLIPECVVSASRPGATTPSDGYFDDGYDDF